MVVCGNCGFPLCDNCWTHNLGSAPWCSVCATEVQTRAFRRWSWAASFLGIATGACLLCWRTKLLADHHAWIVFGAILAAGVFAYLVHRALSNKSAPNVALRSKEEPIPGSENLGAAHPYRARLRNAALRIAPQASGTLTVALVLVSLLLCAVLFPIALHLPRWVEFEVVVATWWVVFSATLTLLLYKGLRLADDYRFTLSRPGTTTATRASKPDQPKKSRGWWDPSGCADPGGCVDAEGCVGVLVVGAALLVAVGAAWLVAELIVPVFFAACYLLLSRALSRVANDKHDCAGHLGRALGWGMLWATVYVGPLAVIVWVAHVWLKSTHR